MATFMHKLYNCIKLRVCWCCYCDDVINDNVYTEEHKKSLMMDMNDDVKFVLMVLDFSQKQAAHNQVSQNYTDAINWILNGVMPRQYFRNNLITILDIANSLPEYIVLNILESLDMYWILSIDNKPEGTQCKNIIQQFQKRKIVVENQHII
jgi:hypothetical protein